VAIGFLFTVDSNRFFRTNALGSTLDVSPVRKGTNIGVPAPGFWGGRRFAYHRR
jgi:hypothetical protein